MKKFFFLFLCCFFSISLCATQEYPPTVGKYSQDTVIPDPPKYWKFSGTAGLNITQVGLWNWAGGGNNNANGRIFGNLTLNYKRERLSWDTNLDTEFGLMYVPETAFTWRKSSDKINFSTKLGYEFSKTWFLTMLGEFKSQYAKGYEYKTENGIETETYVSKWLSPSYTDLSIGVDYKPNTLFSFYLSPLAGRVTTSTDTLLRAKYGVPLDKPFIANLGMVFKAGMNYSPVQDLKIITTLTLYSPYTSKTQPFGNIDVDWDLTVSYQFFRVLNVSLSTSLRYYDQVKITDKNGNTGPRTQFKEVIGVGVGYSF